jgi:DNA-binding NarL/FixJ family response regulator
VSIRVVVAEDNLLIREGVRAILASDPEVELAAVAADYDELVSAVAREHPQVVVTDISMPPTLRDEGIRVAEQLRRSDPGVGVVVLSQHESPAYALALLEEGVAGRAYLLKERLADPQQLLHAIREVSTGGSVLDPRVVQSLVDSRSRRRESPLKQLTARELEVLDRMARGQSNPSIAQSLVLTVRAVERHINSIFAKLQLAAESDYHKRVRAVLLFLAEQG